MRGRKQHIGNTLNRLQDEGRVASWYSYSPGDSGGQRWVVEHDAVTSVFSTREAEAFMAGASLRSAAEARARRLPDPMDDRIPAPYYTPEEIAEGG